MNKKLPIAKETQLAIDKLVSRWEKVRNKYPYTPQEYGAGRETPIGELWWDNPNLIFVLITDKEEGYEGSQAQIGITKDGKIRWEYQSHCSCDGYENSTDKGEELDLSKKSYQLEAIPLDWESQIRENIKKLLK